MALAARMTPLVTVDTFLALSLDGDARHELIDGEIVAQAHPSPAHSTLQGALARHIGNALDARNRRSGTWCRVLPEAGIRPYFDPTHNYRVADLAVTCEPFDPLAPYTTAPILLIEILSPTEEAKQRAKLHVYAGMPSVREILFLDSLSIRAELHRRDAEGRWPERPAVLVGDDALALETVGLEMPLSILYQGLALPVGERAE
jgi:Uma2 family endonuclease